MGYVEPYGLEECTNLCLGQLGTHQMHNNPVHDGPVVQFIDEYQTNLHKLEMLY